jgi:von Willebrand factor type A domain
MFSFRNKTSVLAILFVFPYSAQAQNADNCSQRSIIVNVRDQKGKLVAWLQPTSFQASFRGHQVKVVSDRVLTTSPRIVLLVDISESINSSNHSLAVTKFLAENFVAGSTTSRIALVLFSDHIVDTLDFDRKPSEMFQRLASVTDGDGKTALLDSLAYSAKLFHTREPGDTIYVITDAVDNRSKLHERDIEHELLSRGIRLFSFVFSDPSFVTVEEGASVADFKKLTEETGGSSMNPSLDQSARESQQMDASLRHLYDMMRNFYELEVEVPHEPKTEQRWELKVVDSNGKKRKDVELTYPRSLLGCGSS